VQADTANMPYGTAGGSVGRADAAAGDLFNSSTFEPFGRYEAGVLAPADRRNHGLWVQASTLGLQEPANHGSLISPTFEDDLDAVEVDDILSYVDPDGDGLHNKPVFFTLGKHSPSIAGTTDTSDILVSLRADTDESFTTLNPGGNLTFGIFADRTTVGLGATDMIDALVLSDVSLLGDATTLLPNGVLDARDEALFSLAPGSPALTTVDAALGRAYSPADVFYTSFTGSFSLFASAEALGLMTTDNLDALDLFASTVPEPSSLAILLALCGIASIHRRRRR
jgi:hypothetical protein